MEACAVKQNTMPNSTRKQALSDREREILNAVVNSYITSAEPVGSRTVVKRYGLEWSAATVRNIMADLEEQGYLQQMHTSSGRVPTDLGYRYYVDHLMRVHRLTLQERRRLEGEFQHRLDDVNGLLRHTSQLLALVSHQAGLAESPSTNQALVQQFELVPLGEDRMAVLMVDNYGTVHSVTTSPVSLRDPSKIESLNNFLNQNFRGLAMGTLSDTVRTKLGELLDEQHELAHRKVFGLLEEHDRLITLLRKAVSEGEGKAIFISKHEDNMGAEGIGVVASSYEVDGQPAGLIGVLGPRRMPYSRLTSVVQYTAELLGRFLTRLGK